MSMQPESMEILRQRLNFKTMKAIKYRCADFYVTMLGADILLPTLLVCVIFQEA